jgi:hypothetical protein
MRVETLRSSERPEGVPVNIRLAAAGDNEALIALARAAPMDGMMRIGTDRSPDYFAFPALLGDENEIWVGEDEEGILGCGLFAGRRERVGDRVVRVLHLCDGRLATRARSRGRMFAEFGLGFIQERFRAGGYEVMSGEMMGGNRASLALGSVMGDRFQGRDLGPARSYQLFPWRRYRPVDGYRMRQATAEDLPALAEVLEETYAGYVGAPLFDEETLAAELSRHPTFGIEQMSVAERDGRVVACLGNWDQHSIRRYVVERFSRLALAVVGGARLLRPLFPLPPMPRTGGVLRYSYFRLPGRLPGHDDGLRALVRSELNALRGERLQTLVMISFQDADPLTRCLDGIWKIDVPVHVFRWAEKGNEAAIGEEGSRVYLDASLG